MKLPTGNIHPEVAARVDKMISRGQYEGKFGHLPHAQYMAAKLHDHNVPAQIHEKLGHAVTIDKESLNNLKPLTKHYHVLPAPNATGTAHRILGKFI